MLQKKSVGFVILCRYNSTRLPGKVLLPLYGKPILAYIYERVALVAGDGIVIATSDQRTDDPIAGYCAGQGWNCFRGDLENVAQRFLDCALAWQFDYAVRITGDSLFISPFVLRELAEKARSDKFDVLTNRIPRTFPIGMSVDVVRVSFYEEIISKFHAPEHFEHVTSFLYETKAGRQYHLKNTMCPEAAGIQMAIDSPEDLAWAKRLLAEIDRPHTEYDLCDWLKLV